MACQPVTIPSPLATKDIFKERNGLHRSSSCEELTNRVGMKRSFSDNHLCYSVNRIRAASAQPRLRSSRSVQVFPLHVSSSKVSKSFKSFMYEPERNRDVSIMETDMNIVDVSNGTDVEDEDVKSVYWVERLLEIRSDWKSRRTKETLDVDGVREEEVENVDCHCEDEGCLVSCDWKEQEHNKVVEKEKNRSPERFDRESFSKLLDKVSWSDTKTFSQLALLSNMAYAIPQIKAEDLRRDYGLHFVTSSLEKKADTARIRENSERDSTRVPVGTSETHKSNTTISVDTEKKRRIRSSFAHEIAASAASYVQTRAKSILSLGSRSSKERNCVNSNTGGNQLEEEGEPPPDLYKSVVAAHAAVSTVTVVVAAGEKEKQEAARDLQSLQSSPCEWFVCDDTQTYTRCFVIQGSESLASWQANLFFEPTTFEGTDVLVHRGIYEAAKGIYKQFLPEVMSHLEAYGHRAKFRFTGHSLGGSLSLLISLMLLTRGVLKPHALQPVVTFGSPFVFCGGQKIFNDLGLEESHVHCVMMHRDIVPRAFSCNYPNHVALILKRLNRSFRSHPCLAKNNHLYSPLGKLFILQPSEKSSPTHPLIPPGNALYVLDKTKSGYSKDAVTAFLNCPHPLETLSDPKAYGSEGSILRDHESKSYLKVMNEVLRHDTKLIVRKARKEVNFLWPSLTSPYDRIFENDEKTAKEVMSTGM